MYPQTPEFFFIPCQAAGVWWNIVASTTPRVWRWGWGGGGGIFWGAEQAPANTPSPAHPVPVSSGRVLPDLEPHGRSDAGRRFYSVQQQRAGRRGRGLFFYARRLLCNGTFRPSHDAVPWWPRPGASWTRRRATWPGEDGLPANAAAEVLFGAAAGAGGAAPPGRHAGLPRRRDEAVGRPVERPNNGGGTGWTTL